MTAPLEEIRRLEHVGLATWPALDEAHDGAWVLRAAAGVTSRSNSVSPLGLPSGDLDSAVARVEAWYDERGLSPMFRLCPLAPGGLEPHLEALGYRSEAPVEVMSRPVDRTCAPPIVHIRPELSDGWLAQLMAHRFAEGTPSEIVRSMLMRLNLPTAYASRDLDAALPAMGMAVIAHGIVAIYAMYTPPSQRRTGAAGELLAALLGWGGANGATTAFLQVLVDNTAARSFYASHGFEQIYRYRYRVRPDDDRT